MKQVKRRAKVMRPGIGYGTDRPYVPGASGNTRPAGTDTYLLDGEPHRFDGKCHDACENVR